MVLTSLSKGMQIHFKCPNTCSTDETTSGRHNLTESYLFHSDNSRKTYRRCCISQKIIISVLTFRLTVSRHANPFSHLLLHWDFFSPIFFFFINTQSNLIDTWYFWNVTRWVKMNSVRKLTLSTDISLFPWEQTILIPKKGKPRQQSQHSAFCRHILSQSRRSQLPV